MDTTTPKRRSSLRRLLVIAGLGLGVLVVAAVAYVVFDPFGGYIDDPFSQEIAGLPAATATSVVDLHDGDTFDLKLSPVQKRIGNATVRMLAYNGSVPGPTLRVAQGSAVTVRVTNQTDVDTTVHWHGLRLANPFHGVPEVSQAPSAPGQSFTYHLRFPDAGVYWYHPHIREDYTQAEGLYGNIVVVPSDPSYWEKANRELTLVLSDILLEGGTIAPVSR